MDSTESRNSPALGGAIIAAIAAALLWTSAAFAQGQGAQDADEAGRPMVVATKSAPPFAYRGPDGKWAGAAIDAMQAVADGLGRTITWREETLSDMLDDVSAGRIDAAVAAITITPEREARLDFTFPYYSTGFGIAVDPNAGGGWFQVVRNFFTWQFAAAIAGLAAVLLLAGAAVWAFERRSNEEFPRSPAKGLGDGFWWAAVTMTTVGYGDKSPRTLGGRIVGLIWMFTAMLIVASFTAAIAASLTVGSLGHPIKGLGDLSSYRVGVVSGTTGAQEMASRGIRATGFDSVADGYDSLLSGRIGAFVHDRPLLQWIAAQDFQGEIRVLPDVIGRQDYGIALPPGSKLREPANRILLTYLQSDAWQDVLNRYLKGD